MARSLFLFSRFLCWQARCVRAAAAGEAGVVRSYLAGAVAGAAVPGDRTALACLHQVLYWVSLQM